MRRVLIAGVVLCVGLAGTIMAAVVMRGRGFTAAAGGPTWSVTNTAHYLCNDNAANTTVADASGTDTATLAGGDNTSAKSEAGKINSALHFNGSDDYFYVASPSFIDHQSGSIVFWMKTDNIAGRQMVVCASKDGATDDELIIQYRGDAADEFELLLTINGVSAWQAQTANGMISDTNWHHIAMTSDGSTVKFYVDSTLKTLTDDIGANAGQWFGDATDANIFSVGCLKRAAVTLPFDGLVDDVRIFDQALTTNQIQGIYNSGNGTEADSG